MTMATTDEREELRRLVDNLTDDQVRDALAAVKQVRAEPGHTAAADAGLAWIGIIKDGPEDLAERARDILRREMGERRGPAA